MPNINPTAWCPGVPETNSKCNPRYNAFANLFARKYEKKIHLLTIYSERNAQFGGTAQQFTPQMLCSNISGRAPGMSALPVAGIRGSQSTAPEEISAAAQRPDPHVPQAGPLSVHHPVLESVLEYSPRNRPYRGPAIVSSDMAISDMAIRGYT